MTSVHRTSGTLPIISVRATTLTYTLEMKPSATTFIFYHAIVTFYKNNECLSLHFFTGSDGGNGATKELRKIYR